MADPEIHVDPNQLDALADVLEIFAHDVEIELSTLTDGLAQLGATWQDQEYVRFRDAIRPMQRILDSFRDEIRRNKPKLHADAEAIRAYLRLGPP